MSKSKYRNTIKLFKIKIMWLDIVKFIISKYQDSKKLKIESRNRLSDIFSEISELIYSTVDKLKSDIYPQHSCFILKSLSEEIIIHLKEITDVEILKDLHEKLIQASNLEAEYAKRKDEHTIEKLIYIGAKFKSLAILYK